MITQIIKIANKIILSQNIREFKNYLRQKLNKDNTLSELDKSTLIGNKTKEITDLFKQQGLNNQNYQNKALNFIIQKTKNINDKDTLLKLLTQDLVAIISTIKNYDYIIKNMTNQLDNNQKNINNFNTYQDLFTFVQNLEQQRKSLEELQERRALGLPFKKLYTKGGFSMYKIDEQDKQNFQSMFNGQTGTISKTSWCVTFKTNDYFQSYKPPFYLIMNSSNTAQALICIHKHEFKDIKNYPYQHNNKAVYDLVFQLFNNNNISYEDYKDDFDILIKYLSQQKKAECINYYLNNQNKKSIYTLLQYIYKGVLSNDLTNQQKQYIINDCLHNHKDHMNILLSCINQGYLLSDLTDQQTKQLVNYYIDQYQVWNLFECIEKGYLPNKINNQQKDKIIDFFITNGQLLDLFDYIEKGYLPNKINNQQKQKIIDYSVDNENLDELFKCVKKGYLNISNQERQQIIHQFIDRGSLEIILKSDIIKLSQQEQKYTIDHYINNDNMQYLLEEAQTYDYNFEFSDSSKQKIINYLIDYEIIGVLMQYVDSGYLILTEQEKQKIINYYIENTNFQKLFYYIEQGYLSKLTNQQIQRIVNYYIGHGYFYDLFEDIENEHLPDISNQQKQYIINCYIEKDQLDYLFEDIEDGYLPELNEQQKEKIIDLYIDNGKITYLMSDVRDGYYTLTEQQKQKIKKIDPNVRFSKILTTISKILK